jgi:hypothetical protein
MKAVRSISPDAAEPLKALLLSDGNVDELEFDRSVAGLCQEDEFAVLCKIMGTATLLVELGQRPIIQSDLIPPDFLIRFETGCELLNIPRSKEFGFKCLVEVKATAKDEFKIKGSLLRRRREFADLLGMPLLFAVRFMKARQNAVWAVVWDRDRSKSSLSVGINDVSEGVGPVIWNDFLLMLRPDLMIIKQYDKSFEVADVGNIDHGAALCNKRSRDST